MQMQLEVNGMAQEACGAVPIALDEWQAGVRAEGSCGSPSQVASGSHNTGSDGMAPSRGGARDAKARAVDLLHCQVETCRADLSDLKEYHQRYKICEYHLKVRQASCFNC